MKNALPIIVFIIVPLLIFGCDLAKPQSPVAEAPAELQSQDPGLAPPAKLQEEVEMQEPQEQIAESVSPPAEEPKKEDTVRVKAEVGAGKKGHYGQKGGETATDIITVPVATLFRAKEMTAYRIQVPQALQLYKAMNDGKGPASNEEYMEKIIKANNIPLPELPDGQRYVYDPETEELMIEKPKQQ
ncbi:hypothetical protein FACS189427_06560 [Planctomycetales bacterium]|nr:hypothetical protein FACS189427_06560 [Planctomycetales bacterium]